jgi:hypothetical protein
MIKKLKDKFPELLVGLDDYSRFDSGWNNLVADVVGQIHEYTEKHNIIGLIRITCIKEKFGSLRIYCNNHNKELSAIIKKSEKESEKICEKCSLPSVCIASKADSIYVKNLCAKCAKENEYVHTHSKIQTDMGWYLMKDKKYKATVAIDFDGVIHSYTSGFQGLTTIPDPPVKGGFEFIERCQSQDWQVAIYSTRGKTSLGRKAIHKWFLKHGMKEEILSKIVIAKEKPIAKVYIDDRGWQFRGKFPTIKEIDEFVPWHGGKSSSEK